MALTQRQQNILHILTREQHYVTVASIAEELGVSNRTIHSDLNAIVKSDSSFQIEKKQGVGVRLLSTQLQSNRLVISDTNLRKIRIIRMLLFEHQSVTINELSLKFYVSSTSISQDFNEIRQSFLDGECVELVSDHNGTRFIGNEQQIQKTMLRFNDFLLDLAGEGLETLDDVSYLYPYYGKNLVDICLDVILSLENYNLYNVAKHYEVNVFNELVVMSFRLMKGKHIEVVHNALKVDEVLAMKNYLIAKDLLEMLALQMGFSYSEPDIYSLSMYLQANRLEFNPSSKRIDQEFEPIVMHMIERMSLCVGVSLVEDQELYRNVLVHLYHMVYRMKHKIYIRNPLLNEIKEEFRLMFDLTWLVVDDEREHLEIDITEDEVGFLMLHFQQAIDKVVKSKRVLVVCPNGVVSSGFIISRIKTILPPLDIVESVSSEGASRFDLEHIDLIISTIPLAVKDKPIVVVSPLITEKDLEAINKLYQQNLVSSSSSPVKSFTAIAPYILPELVFMDQKAQTMAEVLNQVADVLEAMDVVTPLYRQSLFDREDQGGTDLSSGAAVPHGSLDEVKKTRIVIWVNQHGIKWGKSSVRVVVFFVLSRHDLGLAKQLLEDIFRLVKSKKYLNTFFIHLNKEEVTILLKGGRDLD